MIHHHWSLDITNTMSNGFFVGATPTYTLLSTFKQDLCTLITKKTNIHRRKIPKFQVALTVVRATMVNPMTKKYVRDACMAFELQVPVSQRQAMEELCTKMFKDSTANGLNFIYYKQRHLHQDVFYRAVQAQCLHEESYRVVAVEGIQDIQHIFHFESRLQQQFPKIKSILPTLKSTDTKMACVIHTCHQSVRCHFDNSKLIMARSTRSYGSTYKPGGTLQLSRGSMTGRVVASGNDNMGRWCWTTYNSSANQ
jgi:hypothetical protein